MNHAALIGFCFVLCAQTAETTDDPRTFLYGDERPLTKPLEKISTEAINTLKNDLFEETPSPIISNFFEKKLHKMNQESATTVVRLSTVLGHLLHIEKAEEKYDIFEHISWKLKSNL